MNPVRLAAIVAASTLVALSAHAGHGYLPKKNVEIPDSNCFWTGPYVRENPVTNIAYPDTGAKYWATNFAMPEGSTLKITGRYMHNRYMSYNSYDIAGDDPTYSPVDAITDVDLQPLFRFAKNPYVEGNRRNTWLRRYVLEVLPGAPVEGDPPNTLRSNAAYGERATLVLRSYVEDAGTGNTAGEYLPSPIVTLADGTVLWDVEEICETLDVDSSIVNIPLIPAATYDRMAAFGNPYHLDGTEANPTFLLKAFTFPENISCDWFGACSPAPSDQPGFYANLDNQYVFGMTTNARPIVVPEAALELEEGTTPLGVVTVGFQKDPELAVAVFRGKLPETPRTREGSKYAEEGEMRYWSFCTNQYMSQKVTDCLYDEQVVTDEDGYYTIAIGWEEDRPANATAECGYNWLPTSTAGDGYLDILEQEVAQGELDPVELVTPNALGQPRANNPYQNMVIVRNMLPAADFPYAIQDVSSYAETASVMGEYAVGYWYESRAAFESRGCH
ncbi:MAG: hypothetical protein QNK03_23980 [Myxococcota bacterium]|nr:hypothetical protein [Myxococcota bacterium]